MKNNKKGIALLIALIAIFGIYLVLFGHTPLFSLSGNSTACGLGSYCQPPLVGGAITGISYLNFSSNYAPLNGPAYLVSETLDGAGQFVFGQTISNIVNSIDKSTNSSYKTNSTNNINITMQLNSQQLVVPYYTYSGQKLIYTSLYNRTFNFGWFSNGAGLLTYYSQVNQTNKTPTYTFAVWGSSSTTDIINVFNAYSNQCKSLDGTPVLVAQGSTSIAGIPSGQVAYQLGCKYVGQTNLGEILTAGSPTLNNNMTITYNNGTTSHSFILTSTVSESQYQNIELAQVIGYANSGKNTMLGTESPIAFVNLLGNIEFLPYETTQAIQQINSPNGCYQSEPITINGQATTGLIDSLSAMENCVKNQDTNVTDFLQENLQPNSPWAGIKSNGQSFGGIISNVYYGTLNVTNNPLYYPEVQMIVSAKTLGIYVPVAKPKIISIHPNPLLIQSGATQYVNVTVGNNASVKASAYIVVYSNAGSVVYQTPDFSIPTSGKATIDVPISAFNNNYANLNSTDIIEVFSAEMTKFNSSAILYLTIKPNCPSGYVYVNNSNCQSEIHNSSNSCSAGYVNVNNACTPICQYPSVFNVTTRSCETPLPKKSGIGLGWYILSVMVVIIVLLVFLFRRKRKGVKSRM